MSPLTWNLYRTWVLWPETFTEHESFDLKPLPHMSPLTWNLYRTLTWNLYHTWVLWPETFTAHESFDLKPYRTWVGFYCWFSLVHSFLHELKLHLAECWLCDWLRFPRMQPFQFLISGTHDKLREWMVEQCKSQGEGREGALLMTKNAKVKIKTKKASAKKRPTCLLLIGLAWAGGGRLKKC